MLACSNFEVIILAAGLSRRMGDINKLLIPVGGVAMVRHAADLYCKLGMSVTLVLGHDAHAITAALDGLNVSIVTNPDYSAGQAGSVQIGLAHTDLDLDGVLIALADQPHLTDADIAGFCRAFLSGTQGRIMVPWHEGQRGNPVLLPNTLARQIRTDIAAGRTASVRQFIDANPSLVQRYAAPNRHFTTDIDTPEDRRTLLQGPAG